MMELLFFYFLYQFVFSLFNVSFLRGYFHTVVVHSIFFFVNTRFGPAYRML
jgi:hypothetical protein